MKFFIKGYVRPYYQRMVVGFLIKFIGTIMDLCIPYILAYIIDSVIPKQQEHLVVRWGALMIVCSVFVALFNIIANRMASKVARDVTEALRHDLFAKTMHLSNRQTDEFTKPSLISRLTTDTYNLHKMLGRVQRLGVRAPILLIGGLCITFVLDYRMALVLVAIMPMLSCVTWYVSRKSIPLYSQLQETTDRFVRTVREDIAGIRVIKALSKTEFEAEKFYEINKEVVEKERNSGMVMAIINPSMHILLNLGLVGVIIVGAYGVNDGVSEVGKIIAFTTYFTIILHAMMSMSRIFEEISKSISSSSRIEKVLTSPNDMKILEAIYEDTADEFEIIFENVNFSYNKQEDANLKDINFKIKKGEMLGIIGEIGSGKSTIIQLLMRMYDTDKGRILIQGKDIRTYSEGDLKNKFGVVFQNDTIFEETITENITLGRDFTSEEIQEALLYARASEFVESKEDKAEEALNIKGANLSGGQKQRVLIARALVSKPDILILDDSSSALDYKTDAMLRQGLKDNYTDTTLVIVAQRISSIRSADHILVLEDGEMIGYGTHEDLMKDCEVYREISHSQMGEGDDKHE